MNNRLFEVTWFDNNAAYEEYPEKFWGITCGKDIDSALQKICDKINRGEVIFYHSLLPEVNVKLSAEIEEHQHWNNDEVSSKTIVVYSIYDVEGGSHHKEEFTKLYIYEIELLENQTTLSLGWG
jgi:hypothetical protein